MGVIVAEQWIVALWTGLRAGKGGRSTDLVLAEGDPVFEVFAKGDLGEFPGGAGVIEFYPGIWGGCSLEGGIGSVVPGL